jgi:hypothetical protein
MNEEFARRGLLGRDAMGCFVMKVPISLEGGRMRIFNQPSERRQPQMDDEDELMLSAEERKELTREIEGMLTSEKSCRQNARKYMR